MKNQMCHKLFLTVANEQLPLSTASKSETSRVCSGVRSCDGVSVQKAKPCSFQPTAISCKDTLFLFKTLFFLIKANVLKNVSGFFKLSLFINFPD